MKNALATALALALGLGLPAAAQAEVRISGFGQAIGGTTSSDTDTYPGNNYGDDIDFKEESLFAVQISADLNDKVDAVAQVMARGYNDFDAELAWAYANIKMDNGFNLKVGRQRTSFYRYSDFLDVGYAYPWIRTPYAVYNTPWSTLDGLGLTHTAFIGDNWFSQVQVQYGGYEGDARFGGSIYQGELTDFWGASWDLEYNEWLSFRAAYFTASTTVTDSPLDPLIAVLNGNGLGALAGAMDYNEDKGVFTNLGVKAERDDWMLVAEYVTITLEDSIYADQDYWYVSGAYRFGEWQPSITYGAREADAKSGIYAGVPSASPLYPLIVGAVEGQALDETFLSLGVRWDFASNVAFKADWSRYESDIAGTPDSDLLSAGVVFTF